MKRTSPLQSSREIYLPRLILLNSETIRISCFLRHQESHGTLGTCGVARIEPRVRRRVSQTKAQVMAMCHNLREGKSKSLDKEIRVI